MFSSNTSQVSSDATFVEDVFSTYIYKGTGNQNQNIINGIDLSGKGGLVWLKSRNVTGLDDNWLQDTARGIRNGLISNSTAAQSVNADVITATLSNGFTESVGFSTTDSIATWTFRKQPKFFDVVTYTGNGANRTIAHNLGSTPGCIIVKRTDTTGNWQVYHRGLTSAAYAIQVNLTTAQTLLTDVWNSTAPTSTVFSVGTNAGVNASGGTYVAYIFAHNAGGFGLAGTDNVISCGGVTLDSGGGDTTVNLGYEPQWILARPTNVASNWTMFDNMRGWAVGGSQQRLRANLSNIEDTQTNWINITPTGFIISNSFSNPSDNVIYIAIRRGPMKTPTSGTSVFSPLSFNSSSSAQTINPGITTDLCMLDFRDTTNGFEWFDRLRGITRTTASGNPQITSASTAAEANSTDINGAGQTTLVAGGTLNGYTQIVECFRRAPSFMDVVCYTGNSTAGTTQSHNLSVVPQLIIVKNRTVNPSNWAVYSEAIGASKGMALNTTAGQGSNNPYLWNSTTPTATVFSLGDDTRTNETGSKYVAYLFATCAGVSKVGSYTGSGTTKQIDCGFTGGARFVLIKRTDSTGDWYVWDSARGIVSGNDPYLLLNSTAAEVTNTDYIDTYSAGFEISSTAPAAINANGGTFIFLAIA